MDKIKKKHIRWAFMIACIILSSFFQAYVIQTMLEKAGLIPMGFTGLSLLITKILGLFNINISVSYFIIALNLPVAIICARGISKKFTFLSILQITMTSIFIRILHFKPIFDNIILMLFIGGFVYGMTVVLALKVGGSSGGTDFIALYVSNKINKSTWEYVLIFNVILLFIFGFIFGWERAGYSVLFQYITTKTISTFYLRYERVTMQIMTRKSDDVIREYTTKIMHGITKTQGEGGYTKCKIDILYTVVSTYEVKDIVYLVKSIDPDAIINIFKTEDFYGKFYLSPL